MAAPDTLVWSTTGADNCIASGGWSGTQPNSGRFSTGPVTKQTSYTLTCYGIGGTASSSVTIAISSTLPPAGPIAILSPSVRNFTGGTVFQQSPGLVIVDPDPSIRAGQVFVLGGVAYKVVGYDLTSGDPAWFPPDYIAESVEEVYTVAPALDEIFDQVDISGTYTLDASQMVAQSSESARLSSNGQRLTLTARPAATSSIPISLDFDQSDLQIQGNATVAMLVTPNIHYSKTSGFTSSSVGFNLTASATASLSATTVLTPETTVFRSTFSLPIPLTVLDAQSNLVAVSAAAVRVPVSLTVQPSISYGVAFQSTLTAAVSSVVSIAANGSLSTSVNPGGSNANTLTLSSSSVAPSAGSPAAASLGSSLFAGLDLSASLQALDVVNLAHGRRQDRHALSRRSDDLDGRKQSDVLRRVCRRFGAADDGESTALDQPHAIRRRIADQLLEHRAYAAHRHLLRNRARGDCDARARSYFRSFRHLIRRDLRGGSQRSHAGPDRRRPSERGWGQLHCGYRQHRQGILRPNAPHRRLPHSVVSISRQWNISGKRRRHSAARCRPRTNLRDFVLLPRPGQHRKHYHLQFFGAPKSGQRLASATDRQRVGVRVHRVAHAPALWIPPAMDRAPIPANCPAPPLYPAGIMVAQYSGDANYAAQSLSNVNVAAFVLTVSGPLQLAVGGTAPYVVAAADGFSGGAVSIPPNLVWTSSDPTVATVNAGTVTAVAVGTATITVMDPVSLANASVKITVIQ